MQVIVEKTNFEVIFTQIAETESDRVGLSEIDLSYHQYPYKLLFKGSYDNIPKHLLVKSLFMEVWNSPANLVLLPGYHTVEYWIMLLAAKLDKKKVGVFCDSTAFDRPNIKVKAILKRLFFSQCDVFFGYGQRSKEYLIFHGAAENAIYFRCQAAALPHNYNSDKVFAQRTSLNIYDTLRYLYVGRLAPEKNIDDLLRAFTCVSNMTPEARLRIVGTGPAMAHLVHLVYQLNLNNFVEFVGSKSTEELKEEYLNACCLVLPSSSEPWGLVVNEALSYGCPVVVSHRCGCVPELVQDGRTGFVFECGNINDLAEKLVAIPTVFADISETANCCINHISTFNPEAAAKQILDGCCITLGKQYVK